MKKTIHSLTVLLVWCLALVGGREARASHAQAGELTYYSLGNNQYRVRVTFFKDCGGIQAPANFPLTCKSAGCNSSPANTVTATLLPPAGYPTSPSSFTTFQPYCPTVAATVPLCNPNSSNPGPTNTISINYEGTVTLPPAAEWILSVEENARPAVANIAGGTLRLEATLNNLITPLGGGTPVVLQNNSPQFNQQTLPVPFVCWKQSSTLSFSATDVDRLNFPRPSAAGQPDSLVYSLDRPLNGCGMFETYSLYPGGTCVPTVIGGTCILTCPPSGTNTYSATLPIAVANDTIGTCVPGTISTLTVRPRFVFNAQSATFRFTPALYNSTNLGNNKYSVVGKVTEYRKINGRYYKIGSIRRDFLVVVIDCGTNRVPSPPGGTATDSLSRPVIVNNPDTLQLNIRSCNYTRISVPITDPDNIVSPTNPVSQNQLLTVFAPADINTNLLQNGDIGSFVLSRNGTTAPVGTFFFQPSKSSQGTRVLITLRIEDNACPAKGIQYRSIVINIISGQTAKALVTSSGLTLGASTQATICPGGYIDLRGRVSRPDSIRNVATGLTVLQAYSTIWTTANTDPLTNGMPAITNTLNLRVTPSITTRYKLTITPLRGFAPGCGDTTSVLVRVVPEPQARIGLADPTTDRVCAGTPVLLRGTAQRSDNLTDTYTYRWTPGNGLAAADTASQNVTVIAPQLPGRYTYTLTVRGQVQFGCNGTTSTAIIEVIPKPNVRVATNNAYICPGTSATLQATATPPGTFTDVYTYSFLPANGLAAADQNKANPTVNPTVTTRYYVTATGRTQTGCADTSSVLVRVLPKVKADFTTSPDSVSLAEISRPPLFISFTNTSVMIGQAQGSTTTYVWTYQRISDSKGGSVSDAITTFTPSNNAPLELKISGTYRIRLTATVSIGNTNCVASVRERTVIVPDLEVPNIITPNADGLNDVFKISTGGTGTKVEIYNRWGRKVYEQASYQNTWGGDNQPAGVYYYMLTDRNGVKTKGWIEVVR